VSTHIVTDRSVHVQPQIANTAHSEPHSVYKSRLVDASAKALSCGDWFAVAVITATVMTEVADE
jgi:hypothetical protein